MPDKPPYGQPCNNCGQCCREVLCPLAMLLFRPSKFYTAPSTNSWRGPCPALDAENQCGAIKNPQAFSPVRTAVMGKEAMAAAAAQLVGAGKGCDAQVDGEPDDPAFRARVLQGSGLKTDKALAVWGLNKPWGRS